MIEQCFPEDSPDISSEAFFQQDGATPHTSNISMDCLKARFLDRVISTKSDFPWQPRSTDFNPLEFFFWGYMKEDIWKSSPTRIDEIKEKISEFRASIDVEMLSRVNAIFSSRIQRCFQAIGGPFEQAMNVIKS